MTDQPEREMSSLELLLQGNLEPIGEQRNALRSGMVCPGCGHGTLDYNGLLVLECPKCGFTSSEGGGCT